MRRVALVFSIALLVGVLAAGAPAALAGGSDWAVNGTPLAAGQEIPVKLASITPVQLVAGDPALGIDITCTSWKAKGTLLGGDIGTGELTNPKFGHCTQTEEGIPVKAKVQLTSVKLHTGPPPVAGSAPMTVFELIGEICTFKKPRCEPPAALTGNAEAYGPMPGAAGNVVAFPEPALTESTLTIGGSPAQLVGEAVFKLPKHATLSQAEL